MALSAPAWADTIIMTATVDGVLVAGDTSADGNLNISAQSFGSAFNINSLSINRNFSGGSGSAQTNTLNSTNRLVAITNWSSISRPSALPVPRSRGVAVIVQRHRPDGWLVCSGADLHQRHVAGRHGRVHRHVGQRVLCQQCRCHWPVQGRGDLHHQLGGHRTLQRRHRHLRGGDTVARCSGCSAARLLPSVW